MISSLGNGKNLVKLPIFTKDNALHLIKILNLYEFISFAWLNLLYKIDPVILVIRRSSMLSWTFSESFSWVIRFGKNQQFRWKWDFYWFFSEIESLRKKSENSEKIRQIGAFLIFCIWPFRFDEKIRGIDVGLNFCSWPFRFDEFFSRKWNDR